MPAKLIDGNALAAEIRGEVARGVADLKSQYGLTPGLAAVLVGDNAASSMYVGMKEKACAEVGILSHVFRLPNNVSKEELFELIRQINRDPRFQGILVQFPVPPHIDQREIVKVVAPEKDIEGLHPQNMGLLALGEPEFVPCASAAIQRLIQASGTEPSGKHVVIISNTMTVGKPTAILLMQNRPGGNATVTVCHDRTVDLPSLTRQADVLISGVGIAGFIKADMVKKGVVVIDVGINRIEDSTRKHGYRIVGDVDFEGVSKKASAITPVPGGVGPMTIAVLMSNTLKAARMSVEALGTISR